MERAPAVSLKLQGWFQYFDYHGNGRLSKSELLRGIVKAYDAACPSFVVVDVFVMARKQQQKEMPEMNFAFSTLPADMEVYFFVSNHAHFAFSCIILICAVYIREVLYLQNVFCAMPQHCSSNVSSFCRSFI